mgnify:CR=1 FL=1
MNNNMKYFALIAIGYVFIVFTANLSAEEDINPDNNKDSQETKSSEDDSAMDKCMKDAKLNLLICYGLNQVKICPQFYSFLFDLLPFLDFKEL